MYKFFPEVVDSRSPASEERVKHFKGWKENTFPVSMSLISFANFDGALKNATNAQDSAVDQRLAGATYIGNGLLWL